MALLSAFIYSSSVVLTRKRLDDSNYFSATVALTFIGNIILWPLALIFTDLKTVNIQSISFFIIAGVLAPGIARLLYNKGMEVLGASVNASIFATYPLFSSILAVLLLEEFVTLMNWAGIVFIVAGVVFVERSLAKPSKGKTMWISRKGLIFPLLAAVTIAFSFLTRKYGLNIYNGPLLGVAVGYASALLSQFLVSAFSKMRHSAFSKDFRLFLTPGVFLALAWILSFYALSYEKVSIVTPLIQTEPLFILMLTFLKLKGIESVSVKVAIGTILIVMGVSLVSTQ